MRCFKLRALCKWGGFIRGNGMKECRIEISDKITSEIASCLADGLDRVNDEYIGYDNRRPW